MSEEGDYQYALLSESHAQVDALRRALKAQIALEEHGADCANCMLDMSCKEISGLIDSALDLRRAALTLLENSE